MREGGREEFRICPDAGRATNIEPPNESSAEGMLSISVAEGTRGDKFRKRLICVPNWEIVWAVVTLEKAVELKLYGCFLRCVY